VVQARCGDEAWRLWRPGAYDIVITDCNMTEGNGYALAQRIRAAEARHGNSHRCAIWGYTANASQDEITRCRDAGMDDCLFKPLSLAALRQRTSACDHGWPPLHPPWRSGLLFDPACIDSVTGGDEDTMARFMDEMLQSNSNDMSTLAAVLENGDRPALHEKLHAITGVCQMMNASAVLDACAAAAQALSEDGTQAIGSSTRPAVAGAPVAASMAAASAAAAVPAIAPKARTACMNVARHLTALSSSVQAWRTVDAERYVAADQARFQAPS
jgi:two-component system sensor histidine kinase EvgS